MTDTELIDCFINIVKQQTEIIGKQQFLIKQYGIEILEISKGQQSETDI